jgi:hypothetical protein
MSNKTHLRPRKQQQQPKSRVVIGLLMALLFLGLVIIAVAMVSSGHGVPPGVR